MALAMEGSAVQTETWRGVENTFWTKSKVKMISMMLHFRGWQEAPGR